MDNVGWEFIIFGKIEIWPANFYVQVSRHERREYNQTQIRYQKLFAQAVEYAQSLLKATATRDLQDIVKQNAIIIQGRGAGAIYTLVPFLAFC